MNRGFVGILLMIVVVGGVVGGIAWWALQQDPNASPTTAEQTQGQVVQAIFTYSARDTDFPLGIFQLTGGDRVLEAPYVRVRNQSTAIYELLGSKAGTALPNKCHWSVRASIEIKNTTLDTTSYAYLNPIPRVAVADLESVVSQSDPQQVCTP